LPDRPPARPRQAAAPDPERGRREQERARQELGGNGRSS
jgi:hypothetical protein